jgi:hypothetical protein
MTQAPCFADPRLEDAFLQATLEGVRSCPARSGYVELCFTTAEGPWQWCFPEPSRRRRRPAGELALTMGPYGVQAHLVGDAGLGPALPSSSALPMILAGADVRVARRLVLAGGRSLRVPAYRFGRCRLSGLSANGQGRFAAALPVARRAAWLQRSEPSCFGPARVSDRLVPPAVVSVMPLRALITRSAGIKGANRDSYQ